MAHHPFRFGVVAAQARSGEEWAENARRVEAPGYATLVIPDNIQYTLAPLPALAVVATHTLRIGTYVLANDYRNPVMLAKGAATLDLLSGGRLELGIGAGRPTAAHDNQMLGIPFEAGGVRVARLTESLAIIKPLLAGQRARRTSSRSAAGERFEQLEINLNLMMVREQMPGWIAAQFGAIPVLTGTTDAMCDTLERRRETLGIS